MRDYWVEVVKEALEDAGVETTDEQIDTITSWVESSHENYGMVHGHDAIPNPLQTENDELARKLKVLRDEADKVQGLENDVENLRSSLWAKDRRIYALEERIGAELLS